MDDHDKTALLFAPYQPPALKVGDRTTCLYRDADVIITSWTDALIPWPRCRAVDTPRGGPGLLVNEELARAVRCEASLAIQHWWGVSQRVVWCWRKALGVGQWETEDSKRLQQANAEKGADKVRGKELSEEECDERAERAKRLNLIQYARDGYRDHLWTTEELALLGTDTDEVIAERIGRTETAVRCMRVQLGILNLASNRWSAQDIALLGTMPDQELAKLLSRTPWAVTLKRTKLGIPTFRDRRQTENRGKR